MVSVENSVSSSYVGIHCMCELILVYMCIFVGTIMVYIYPVSTFRIASILNISLSGLRNPANCCYNKHGRQHMYETRLCAENTKSF